MASISACHAEDPGSIPGLGVPYATSCLGLIKVISNDTSLNRKDIGAMDIALDF